VSAKHHQAMCQDMSSSLVVHPIAAAWLCLARGLYIRMFVRSSCTGMLQLYRDAPAIQGRSSYTGTLQLGRYQGRGGRRRQDGPSVHI